MRKFIVVLGIISLAILITACGNEQVSREIKANQIEITDMAGRKVIIPANVQKVYTTTPTSTILVYTLNPNKLVGLNGQPTAGEKKYTSEQYNRLPVLGGFFGEVKTANCEAILKISPDIVVQAYFPNIDNNTTIATADKLQDQLQIPVVLVENSIENMDKAYEFLGSIMGEKNRAGELGNYCRKAITEVKAAVEKVPPEKSVRVYYAEGLDGLTTDPSGSAHTEVIDFVRGINVAGVPVKPGIGGSIVSLENVMAWNPDIIIAANGRDSGSYEDFRSYAGQNEKWRNITAVKRGQVYNVPAAPFNWLDRPPSVARIIGIKWLANLLYPDYVDIDITAATKEFYEKFYHLRLTDQEIQDILTGAVRK